MNFAFEGGDKSPHSKLLTDYDYKILTGYKWVAVYARAVRCDLALKPPGPRDIEVKRQAAALV